MASRAARVWAAAAVIACRKEQDFAQCAKNWSGMLSLALCAAMTFFPTQLPGEIVRGPFGVPHIFAESLDGAFFCAGYAAAQDRLRQMDLSRRSARGRLAAIVGRTALSSDRDAIRFGYTDSEYDQMLASATPKARTVLQAYTRGVNAWIAEAANSNRLPKSYEGTAPEPWTAADTMAIGVNLARQFGRSGAGEIRNLLLFTYLRDKVGDRTLDIMSDLAWQNDASAKTTVSRQDDPLGGVSPFPVAAKDATSKHVQSLPKVNLLELLPGIRLAEQAEMKEIAAQMGVAHTWGSYAMVASPAHSAIGVPVLLSGPQMGFQTPSIIHQMSISCPEYTAVGMSLPGVPGILVGHTPTLAWGVTSGVADTDDIFIVKLSPDDPSKYVVDGNTHEFDVVEVPVAVKGEAATSARREMSLFGPVVIKSAGTGVAYVRKSPLWLREMEGLAPLIEIPSCVSIEDVQRLAKGMNASFNLFAATTQGDIGWFYCGRIPIRSTSVDPRLPATAGAATDWTGFLPPEKLPYAINPRKGWIANWNNKPVSWWPNLDTPVWGALFRFDTLEELMASRQKLSAQDFESYARTLATTDRMIMPLLAFLLKADLSSAKLTPSARIALAYLENWDGQKLDQSVARTIYDAYFSALQEKVFFATTGNFLSMDNFRMVVQPSVVFRAMRRETTYDYLGARQPSEVAIEAFAEGVAALEKARGPEVAAWRYAAGRIRFGDAGEVVYSDRGTYIQIVELWNSPRGRYVAPPGVSGDDQSKHYSDQVPLAQGWTYFPMLYRRSDLP
jgi:penicillin amidase